MCEPGNTLLWDLLQDEKISQLPADQADEAEKSLTHLLCYNLEKRIRVRFMEGCLANVERNRSAAISLRLLPKLLQSLQSYRSPDCHNMAVRLEKKHGMMRAFFDNLEAYTRDRRAGKKPEPPVFTHLQQIQTRLHFLTQVFSIHVSPANLCLSLAQIDKLWECVAEDPECQDDWFQYLMMQVHTKEQHAITREGFKMIYHRKLPSMAPERIPILALNLYSTLYHLSKAATKLPWHHVLHEDDARAGGAESLATIRDVRTM